MVVLEPAMTRLAILIATAIALGIASIDAHAESTSVDERIAPTSTIVPNLEPINQTSNLSPQIWNNSAWTSATPSQSQHVASSIQAARFTSAIQKERALGLVRYQLDHRTAVLGWQVAPRWFLGQQRGDDSGLTLVWQKDGSDQLSLSKDGVRISRRF